MEEFLVIAFSALAFVWIVYDTRRRRFGIHWLLNLALLIVLALWLLFWSWPLVEEAYTFWATRRVDPRELTLVTPAELVERPDGWALRVNFRNHSPAHTVDKVFLVVRLFDCPEPEVSPRCDELLEENVGLRVWANQGRETGSKTHPLPVPADFHIRNHPVVDVRVLGVRNRK